MPGVQHMVGGAGDEDARPGVQVPALSVRKQSQVQHKRGSHGIPENWPFPTYRGEPLQRPVRVTQKQRLSKMEDALL